MNIRTVWVAPGLKVSCLGLGAMSFGDKSWRGWVLDEEESRVIVRKALDHGINFFDTCDYYSNGVSEQILAQTLLKDAPRQETVLATKLGMNMGPGPNDRGFSRKHMFDAIDQSLKRLDTDYIDLYQTHIWDPSTNIEEMMDAFNDLIKSGKVLYIGTTDIPAWQFAKAQHIAATRGWHRFVSVQNHYNLIFREHERELLPLCRDQGIGLIPYSPMASRVPRQQPASGGMGATQFAPGPMTSPRMSIFATRTSRWQNAPPRWRRKTGSKQLKWRSLGYWRSQTSLLRSSVPPGREHVDDAIETIDMSLDAEDIGYLEAAYGPRPL